jgi:hypothetical protein
MSPLFLTDESPDSRDRAFAVIGGGAGNHIDAYLIEYKRFISILLCGYTHIYTHKEECCFLFFPPQ